MRFAFRPVPFAATVVLVTLGILLGNWQLRRAQEKLDLQARLDARAAMAPLVLDGGKVDPAAIEYRRVIVSGTFDPKWTLFLDNRPLDGRTGFIVVSPLVIAGTHQVVLVERGWTPRDAGVHDRLPQVSVPSGMQSIEGVAVQRAARLMELGAPAPLQANAIVQNLDPASFAKDTGLAVLPVMIEQTGAASGPGAPLLRKWPPPALDVERNKGYAVQWYALAAMAFLFFVITGFRRASKPG